MSVGLLAADAITRRLLGRWSTLADAAQTAANNPRAMKDDPTAPTVAVVIPARDAAATLPALLTSLRRLQPAPVEIVVVDDDSHDQTATVARSAGATVLQVTGPPPGWTGKAWACHRGAQTTRSDLLLFLDADTVLTPSALADLLVLHTHHGGLISVQPAHDPKRPAEQLSAYFNLISVLASNPVTIGPADHPAAFGPCLLTSRDDYQAAGGHGAVRTDILDDVALAAAYRRVGLPVRCHLGGEQLRMRMYPGGVAQLAAGWTKNIASGAISADPATSAGVIMWIAGQHLLVARLLHEVLSRTRASAFSPTLVSLWLVAYLANAARLRLLLRQVGSFSWWAWAVFPVPLAAFDVLFVRSILRTVVRGSVQWRDRAVPVIADRTSKAI